MTCAGMGATAGPPRTKRYLVMQEILTTERTYVHNLEALRDVYVAPLIADANCKRPTHGQIVSTSAAATVFFSTVDRMTTLNGDLLRKLEARFAESEWTTNEGNDGRVGDIFERYAPLFKVREMLQDQRRRAAAEENDGTLASLLAGLTESE